MSRVQRPSTKVMVFDPRKGNVKEADTTDVDEMERRQKLASATAKAAARANKSK